MRLKSEHESQRFEVVDRMKKHGATLKIYSNWSMSSKTYPCTMIIYYTHDKITCKNQTLMTKTGSCIGLNWNTALADFRRFFLRYINPKPKSSFTLKPTLYTILITSFWGFKCMRWYLYNNVGFMLCVGFGYACLTDSSLTAFVILRSFISTVELTHASIPAFGREETHHPRNWLKP